MKIGAVILNYNGWKDTLACVESVLKSEVPPLWIVIVDNASKDDSVDKICLWCAGNVDFITINKESSCCQNSPGLRKIITSHLSCELSKNVILLRSPENKGYAAGNNAGIKLLLQWGADAVWILNNDTIVDKGALGAMRDRLFSKQRPGLCGARIHYIGTDIVQCRAGGKTNPWTGLSYLNGYKYTTQKALLEPPESVESQINFIYGASVLASRTFLETVGLMCELYFLYCEEQDWAYRAKGRFEFAYAKDAIVYHKEGASTGFSSSKINLRSLYHLTRSRLLLTARHHPWALPTVCAGIFFAALRMVWRRMRK